MKLAFVGGGNMAQALLGGMRAAGMTTQAAHVIEPDAAKGAALARDFGATAHGVPGDWLREIDLVVLAVKPQHAREAVLALQQHMARPLVLSIMAGVRGATLARWLGHARIVRAMPNTPALIGAGITGAVALAGADAADRDRANAVLRSVGRVVWLGDEALLDPVTAISGSGPAYVFSFIEALARAGESLGFTPEQARELAIATVAGAAQLAQQSHEPPSTLRERVTSKGGTTAAALAVLEERDFAVIIEAAVRAACERATTMGREFDSDRG